MFRRSLVRGALVALRLAPVLALASCARITTMPPPPSGGVPIEVTTGYLDATTSPPTFVDAAEVAVGQQLALQVKGEPDFVAGETLEIRYSLTDALKEPPSLFTVAAAGAIVVIPIAVIEEKLPYGRSDLQVTVHARRHARVDTQDRVRNVGEGASVRIVGP